MFSKTASYKSSILFLVFMFIWLIITLFILFIHNFFNVAVKLSSTDWPVIENNPLTFLDRPWEISLSLRIAVVFERSYATSQKRLKGCAGSNINLLMHEHPFTLQIFLVKYSKLVANWISPEKFKWSPKAFLPIQRSAIILLLIISIGSCKKSLSVALTSSLP